MPMRNQGQIYTDNRYILYQIPYNSKKPKNKRANPDHIENKVKSGAIKNQEYQANTSPEKQ